MPRERLAERRRELGLSQGDVADAIGVEVGNYSRYERGLVKPRPAVHKRLAEKLDWSPAQLAYALDDVDTSLNGQSVPTWLTLHAALEQKAAVIWAFQPFTVHALLQTADYAFAVEQADAIPKSEDALARRVETRLARQKVLDLDDPVELRVILDESVLHRVTGPPSVMAHQLDHLAAVAERPNVHLRILSLAAGRHSAAFGGFTLIATEGQRDPQVVCVEDRTGFRYLEGQHDIASHHTVFDHLWEHSLPTAPSIELINHISKETLQ